MLLAIETATDGASVAVGRSETDAAQERVTGARRHASALLPMIASALRRAGVTLDDLTGVAVADGPGSFTGLRVGAAAAKALVQARNLPLYAAPSLMVRAAGATAAGGVIVAVSDALRGEIYAAAYRFPAGAVVTELAPLVCRPEELASRLAGPAMLVGDVPPGPRATLERWCGCQMVPSPEGAPHAARLLGLVGRAGGAARVDNASGWEPAYGRPAEAQARWEATHGRPLPDSVGSPG